MFIKSIKINFWNFLKNVFRSVKKGAILIDSSTIDPDLSKNVAKSAGDKGAKFLDAPVSGGKYDSHNKCTSKQSDQFQ